MDFVDSDNAYFSLDEITEALAGQEQFTTQSSGSTALDMSQDSAFAVLDPGIRRYSWDVLDLPHYTIPGDKSQVVAPLTVYNFPPLPDNPLRFENTKRKYTCKRPGCNQKPFGRSADLDRHYKQVHLPSDQEQHYFCDYKICGPVFKSTVKNEELSTALYRKDLFLDHLRDFHYEDLPSRSDKNNSAWLRNRWIDMSWWRCGKCFMRVKTGEFGWECPNCKIFCELERQELRNATIGAPSTPGTKPQALSIRSAPTREISTLDGKPRQFSSPMRNGINAERVDSKASTCLQSSGDIGSTSRRLSHPDNTFDESSGSDQSQPSAQGSVTSQKGEREEAKGSTVSLIRSAQGKASSFLKLTPNARSLKQSGQLWKTAPLTAAFLSSVKVPIEVVDTQLSSPCSEVREKDAEEISEDTSSPVRSDAGSLDTTKESPELMAQGDSDESEPPSVNAPDSSSDDSASTESSRSWMSIYSEEATLEDEHPLASIKSHITSTLVREFRAWKARITHRGGGSNRQSESIHRQQSQGSSRDQQPRGRKNPDSNRDECGEDDDADNYGSISTGCKRKRTETQNLPFACPFTKKDPLRYRDCYRYTLTRVRDVKQHVGRRHRLPIYCPRCTEIFSDEDARDVHSREVLCTVSSLPRHEGITESQKKKLSEKVSATLSPEQQWYSVYDILFPNHQPRPDSPYLDTSLYQDITLFQRFANARGPQIILNTIRSVGFLSDNNFAQQSEQREMLLQAAIGESIRNVFDIWASENGLELPDERIGLLSTVTETGNISAQSASNASRHTQPSIGLVDADGPAQLPASHMDIRESLGTERHFNFSDADFDSFFNDSLEMEQLHEDRLI